MQPASNSVSISVIAGVVEAVEVVPHWRLAVRCRLRRRRRLACDSYIALDPSISGMSGALAASTRAVDFEVWQREMNERSKSV